jgi:hypothetical protein
LSVSLLEPPLVSIFSFPSILRHFFHFCSPFCVFLLAPRCFISLWKEINLVNNLDTSHYIRQKKVNAISVTGHGSPYGYETSRVPHFLDNRLTDGGEFDSLTRRPPFIPRKIPGTHFC